jgi:hypothetical protein
MVSAMKLAVPDMISNSYFPAIAAIELGFFGKEGLDVELELIFPVDKAYAALLRSAWSTSLADPLIRRSPPFPSGRTSSYSARRLRVCAGFL